MDMYETKTTEINNGIMLTEYTDGLRFGTDALLLARFVRGGARKKGVDIGTGCGSISLILLSENKAAHITGIEIQPRFAALAAENARANGFGERFAAVVGDARCPAGLYPVGEADYVVSNPPFMKAASGKHNDTEAKTIARHEEYLPPEELCAAASLYLKYGGSFYVVYRPERICTLITAMKAQGLEPKRIAFAGAADKCALVLVEAKKGGAEGTDVSFIKI